MNYSSVNFYKYQPDTFDISLNLSWSSVHCHFLFLICRIHFSTLVVYCPSFCKAANVCANSCICMGFYELKSVQNYQSAYRTKVYRVDIYKLCT